jgi:hypothetical protein
MLWTHYGGGDEMNAFLPVGITSSRRGKPAHMFSENRRMKFWIRPDNGEVTLYFQEREGESWKDMSRIEEILYLETQCPWP